MAELKDFGEKIGGARKDLWKTRGLMQTDLAEMNDLERKNHVKKDNIWIRPNWEQAIAEGTPQSVAYWQNKMRQAIPPKPPVETEEAQANYIDVVCRIRDAVMSVQDPYKINDFYNEFLRPNFVQGSGRGCYVTIVPEASGVVNNKVLKAAQEKKWRMEEEAKKNLFGVPKGEKTYEAVKGSLAIYKYDGENVTISPDDYSPDRNRLVVKSALGRSYYYLRPKDKFYDPAEWQEGSYFVVDNQKHAPLAINFESQAEAKEFVESFSREAQALADKRASDEKDLGQGKTRKGAFVPPQLKHIHREGPKYLGVRSANEDLFLEELKFRGGEYGNWLSNDDRQANLNMGYEAFRDLARVLQMRPEDVALNNTLAIAFGARGRGGANAGAAHYEPDRQVINLTKMSGAGCLAHEWGHALDHAIGRACGQSGLASEAKSKKDLPESFKDLLASLRYKVVTVQPGELSDDQKAQVEKCQKNLKNWIASVRPKDMPADKAEKWEEITKTIIENKSSITGVEYQQYGGRRNDVVTNPEIEMLSQIRKQATNHVMPKDAKQQIVIWASMLRSAEQRLQEQNPVERRVKTEFYKGSIAFDNMFSKATHGYWQSECEMFARAFDCYIADKLKAAGQKSDYLSAYADGFKMPGKDGEVISAVPVGDERELLNQKFDVLIADLKERGIIRDFVEDLEAIKLREERPSQRTLDRLRSKESDKPVKYEQMTMDDLLRESEAPARKNEEKDNQTRNYER